ncbi:MAG: CDP-diacylglycerol--serine O-phosphatidyltransferase [Bacteroidales bacterium]|nr:CDP-diacylglycerol--serine O-phosphatidyltransferase [Bacteroidales bacterium]MCF8389040.1 CDP-diacylglycerol--serine O-phosphatidyltransferase [Bacteroidales bacterium]MCF8397327.1 CDP-diacylglycerol--serine O-phosphatidyltransferase [Bacteroidales bacterium]
MKLKKHLPNFITLLNLFFGCLSILAIILNNLSEAAIFIFIAAFFDLLDGLAARILKAGSEIGKELDSLADIVSFGAAPGFILWKLLDTTLPDEYKSFSILAFIIPLISALRLAKFNLDSRQKEHFIGLPVPANAILIASFPMIFVQEEPAFTWISQTIFNSWFLIGYILVFSFLLVSEIPLISMKFKGYHFSGNQSRYLLLVAAVILVIFFRFIAIPFILILYFIISLIHNMKHKRV